MHHDSTQNPHTPAIISVDRNRWFIVSVVLFSLLTLSVWDSLSIRTDAIDRDIVWVRIFPNGTWEVSIDDVPNQQKIFTNTVEAVLSHFAKNRYEIIPFTMSDDYGAANALMSPSLSRAFLGDTASDFNAPLKVAEAIKCGLECFEHHVQIVDVVNYDRDFSSLNKGDIFRSNVFLEEFNVDPEGSASVKHDLESNVVDLTWRILNRSEILSKYPATSSLKDMREYLRTNPIGIEILSYEKYAQTKQ